MHARSPAPIVSVVIPAYNRAHFLAETLASVLAQRDCPPFEVVVVDDGSTDATPALLGGFATAIRTVRLPTNLGVARARHAGAAVAAGSLLAFHDSDDLMLPGRIGRLAAFLDAHDDVDAVFANGLVDGTGAHPGTRVVPGALARRLDGHRVGIRSVLRDGLPLFLQAALLRRGAFDRAGGFDESLARHADLDLACRLVLAGSVVFLDVPVFRYRLHGANQTRDRLKLREGMVAVLRRLRRHPDAVAELGAAWFRRRERRHLYRIAWRHWMSAWNEARPARLAAAAGALRQALSLAVRDPPAPAPRHGQDI